MTINSTNLVLKKVIKTEAIKPKNIFEVDTYDSYFNRDHINPEKLKTARIGIQGGGGLGSFCSSFLCRMGIGYLEISDGDNVELKNLPIQLFYPNNINKNKVLACLDNLRNDCTQGATLIGYPMDFIETIETYPNAYSSVQMLISLVDNHKARYEAAEFGIRNNIPVLFAGVSEDMKICSVFIQKPGEACFNCFKPGYMEKGHSKRNICKHLAVLTPHVGAISLVLHAVIEIIMNRKLSWNYYYLSFDGSTISGYHKENSKCELCGI